MSMGKMIFWLFMTTNIIFHLDNSNLTEDTYNFNLTNRNNKMILQAVIKGVDGMKFEREIDLKNK